MMPKNWDAKPLGDIATISSGGTPSRKEPAYWGGDIPWIRTTEVQNCKIYNHDVEEFITQQGLDNSSAKIFPVNTILLAMIGQGKTRGQVALLTFEAATNQNSAAIILNDDQSPEFHFNFLKSQYENIRGNSNSAGQSNLNGTIIKSLRVPVPPQPEQTKIAQILSTWDQAIATTEKLIENSKTQKKSLMQQLLTGKKRLPGFSGEWREYRFNQIFDRLKRKNTVGNDNVLTISGKNGLVSQRDYFKKRVASENLEGYTLLHRGDFAYNKSYSNGYPYGAIKPLNRYDAGVVSSLYICFYLIKPENHDHDFFRHFFEGGYFDREIYAIAQEGARNHGLLNVSSTDFFITRLRIPSLNEQAAVAKVVNTAEAEQHNIEQQLELLQLQKKALMQQLLTGKRRVQVEESSTS